MSQPSFRKRIRNGTLLMLLVAVMAGALALPEVHRLGGAIRETLYRNYLSIEAAQHMHQALWDLQLALCRGDAASVQPRSGDEFMHWINVEQHDITEAGEAALADDVEQRGRRIFAQAALGHDIPDADFAVLHRRLDQLIVMNRDAMFRARSRANRMSDRLTYEFAAALALLLLLGAMLSWTLARSIAQPLDELADRLRSFSLRGPSLRLGQQPLAELQTVAAEFNRMAERLEHFERLNVDRLIFEKSKTEAIIESLEDGIVLIDVRGFVIHINEVAAIILGLEREDALGSRFDDLNSSSPHYLRVRAALRRADESAGSRQLEVDLHVRGRAHTYLLKPLQLGQHNGEPIGTILILQDVTYLRDKDRARTNLVATLSHELKTPLTSLGLSAELLQRRGMLDREQREMLDAIQEDVARMRQLANNLLELARDQVAISVQAVEVDLAQVVRSVSRTFTRQAEQKQVKLETVIESSAVRMLGDPLKLSWVVSNLIANALRYTPSGGAISVRLAYSPPDALLRVSDTGPGIEPELRQHLFERFSQWSVNGAEPGSAGLGLAIAKEIVEAHGGRIFVDSTVGQGTCFTVELPVGAEAWQSS